MFRTEQLAQLQDLQRTFGPVVFPADDEVALFRVVTVTAEVAAFEFEFDSDELAFVADDAAHGFAVREVGMDAVDDEAKLPRHGSEEEDDADFVDRRIDHGPGPHGRAI